MCRVGKLTILTSCVQLGRLSPRVWIYRSVVSVPGGIGEVRGFRGLRRSIGKRFEFLFPSLARQNLAGDGSCRVWIADAVIG